MSESEKFDLRTLAPSEWFEDDNVSEVLFVFFPTSAIWQDVRLGGPAARSAMSAVIEYPISFAAVELPEGLQARDFRMRFTYSSSGMNVNADLRENHIDAGHYLILMTPIFLSPKGGTQDGRSYTAILSGIGWLCARFGHTIALNRALELRFSTSEERQSQTSEVFENFWLPSNFEHFDADKYTLLLEKVGKYCTPELRQRLRTGFRFLGNTVGKVDPLYRFANAWIALEVVCGSSGKALQALNAIAPKEFSDDAKRIKDARDDLFHKGIVYQMSYHEEHWLFAAIFWHVANFYNLGNHVAFDSRFFGDFQRGEQLHD